MKRFSHLETTFRYILLRVTHETIENRFHTEKLSLYVVREIETREKHEAQTRNWNSKPTAIRYVLAAKEILG